MSLDALAVSALPSLSARRAWIEIVMQEIAQQRKQRRAPQGERG